MKGSSAEVFDQMASGWYNVRHFSIFRPELEQMALRWREGKLLNLGCGHGADFLPFKEYFKLYGVDVSPEMIKMARKYMAKYNFEAELKVADARNLPFPDGFFDCAIAVAVLHHIEGEEDRELAFRELKRVLKKGGEAFITVWNHGQSRFRHQPKEVFVPWQMKGKTLYRYYYLFSYKEIESLSEKSGFEVLESKPEASFKGSSKAYSRNICLLLGNR